MAFSPDFLEELHARNDIVEFIGQSVPLKRAGRTYKGLCPFHNEKTPSFVVYPENGSFYCFGCQKGGDIITYVMEAEHLSYREAVQELASRAGMPMPEEKDDGSARLKLDILSANREAARFFHRQLNEESGAAARAYLRGRALTDSTIVRFGIGYAPDSWQALYDHLRAQGFSDEVVTQAGLCASGRKGGCYDIFRNRVMFPIIDIRGNVVAFGGRRLNENDRAKYVNTSDTPVYKKSRNLYALNIAKANADRRIIIAEGYLDVISLHQASFSCAVAALGTALTPEQAHLIRQYADEVVLCYDSDEPGQKATRRAIEVLKPTGALLRVITVENAKDPDEYIKKFGAESFSKLIERSGTSVEYELEKAARRVELEAAAGKVEYMQAACAVLARLTSAPEIELYANKVAGTLGISAASVMVQVEEMRKKEQFRSRKQQQAELDRSMSDAFRNFKGDKTGETPAAFHTEQRLLTLLCTNPDYVAPVRAVLTEQNFAGADMGSVFAAICRLSDESSFSGYTSLSGAVSDYLYSQLAMWIASSSGFNATVKDALFLADKLKKLKSKPSAADVGSITPEELMRLVKQNNSGV